jgi:hypothetical protein
MGWIVEIRFSMTAGYISLLHSIHFVSGRNQFPSQRVPWPISPDVKQLGCGAYRSALSNAEVRN